MTSVIQAEYDPSDWYDQSVKAMVAEGTHTEAEAEASMVDCDFEFETEEFYNNLKQIMDQVNPKGVFIIKGSNLDWRGSSGEARFQIKTAKELLAKLAPKSGEFTFIATAYAGGGLAKATCSHHDCPTGSRFEILPGVVHPFDSSRIVTPDEAIIHLKFRDGPNGQCDFYEAGEYLNTETRDEFHDVLKVMLYMAKDYEACGWRVVMEFGGLKMKLEVISNV